VKAKPVIDLSPVVVSDAPYKEVDVLSDWPQAPSEGLDASQWEALHQILTKRLAIVQGPPGTGKTHVSVAALKVLLSNMKPGDAPIIIAAQTNHALDQLINHVALFEKNYVRLGGRSSDPEIRKRTMFEIRQKHPVPHPSGGLLAPAKRDLQNVIEVITKLLQPFHAESSGRPLPASLFLAHGLLTRAQYDSMRGGAKGWTGSALGNAEDPMATWLGDGMVKFDVVYGEENFGFEEEDIDLEYEQLKELEAEKTSEDDLESLKGFYMPLKEGFIGQSSPATSEKVIIETHLKRHDLWQIPPKVRGSVYNVLCKLVKGKIRQRYHQLLGQYEKASVELQIGKWERDLVTLQDVKVVGMTTTGLSKYRPLVSCLKPKIIMIEEAAEVIEAPVVVSCVQSLEHLILVGDHKQLQGNCDVQDLEGEPFFLNVSMFERLVHNGVDFRSLSVQRRMAPEIRQLLAPIYRNLTDHPSVKKYPKVPGMGNIRSFFFCHEWPESSDSLASKYNQNEAQMIVGFFMHLVFNGIPVSDITILTFYNGQRKKLLKLLRDSRYLQGQYVKVVTVDSYQGEENEVVILSLVRSSEQNQIGFLSVENRVCVAMSRARRGFYIFGNGQALAHADPLWWEIIKIIGKNGEGPRRVGYNLPLTCGKHGNMTFVRGRQALLMSILWSLLTLASDTKQWGATNGGCELRCGEKMPCGHECGLHCHR
jgi:helicase required for RNAi-mediated heterochromatin assembly 1